MLAIDANVVVRYLTGDDPDQSMRARRIVDGETVFVTTTVLLETEWVLRGAYGYRGARLAAALTAFAGLPTVSLEAPTVAAAALGGLAQGIDFADALHLAGARDCEAFVTFDRAFAKAANGLGGVPVKTA
jgi:predicted nucleic acid-binding protein